MSQGTLYFRLFASKLSMSHSCGGDQPGKPSIKVALTLVNFCIICIQCHIFVLIMDLAKDKKYEGMDVKNQ